MKKLPYGISNYERIVEDNYEYVDKTSYIEKLENLAAPNIMFLRPRKFGKTLFASVLENYYDIRKKDKFEKLFGETYIGKNPTILKNSYHILRFNFSGIDTTTVESTIQGFKNKATESIREFVTKYGIDFYINENQTAEDILNSLFISFSLQKQDGKIYVIIDEYDHFANELLGFHTGDFRNLVSKNGKVRKWYEILKQGTETVVDRIFITGVAPITLDSLTSGFNVGKDITRDSEFNAMMGFTENELVNLMDSQNITKEEQEKIKPIMKENYDGYKFANKAKDKIYNSNMCLYFLNEYVRNKEVPEGLVDVNIASDYSKLGNMLNLCTGNEKAKVIEKTVSGEGITSDITEKFNPAMEFTEKDLVSILYYLGYLTTDSEEFGRPHLVIPNNVMKSIYSDFFMETLEKETEFGISENQYTDMTREIALDGKISIITNILQEYLKKLSNRDFQRFDEKYVKLIFYCISMNLKVYFVKSELEIEGKYPDILLIPREPEKGYSSVMVEFKYLKKEEKNKLKETQKQAKEQVQGYAKLDEIKNIKNLHKFTVVTVVDDIYVEEV